MYVEVCPVLREYKTALIVCSATCHAAQHIATRSGAGLISRPESPLRLPMGVSLRLLQGQHKAASSLVLYEQ